MSMTEASLEIPVSLPASGGRDALRGKGLIQRSRHEVRQGMLMSTRRAAAVHHRGQRGRRQEHAHRPPALRQQGPAGGPHHGAGGVVAQARARGNRPVAGHRRSAGRARAGHHDRRRLPLLLDGHAQVHHRRLAGARAVHAQHGDGGQHGRHGGAAGGRARRAAAADAPARVPGAVDRHPARAAGRQQDGHWWTWSRERVRGDSTTASTPSRGRCGSKKWSSCRCRPCAATCWWSAATTWAGTPARPCSSTWRPCRRGTTSGDDRWASRALSGAARGARAPAATRSRHGLRADDEFRGYQGTVASGVLRVGDRGVAAGQARGARRGDPHGGRTAPGSRLPTCAVTVRLDTRDRRFARRPVLVAPAAGRACRRTSTAEVCWFDAEPALMPAPYLIKQGVSTVRAKFAGARPPHRRRVAAAGGAARARWR